MNAPCAPKNAVDVYSWLPVWCWFAGSWRWLQQCWRCAHISHTPYNILQGKKVARKTPVTRNSADVNWLNHTLKLVCIWPYIDFCCSLFITLDLKHLFSVANHVLGLVAKWSRIELKQIACNLNLWWRDVVSGEMGVINLLTSFDCICRLLVNPQYGYVGWINNSNT